MKLYFRNILRSTIEIMTLKLILVFLLVGLFFNPQSISAATLKLPMIYAIESAGGYYFRPVTDLNYLLQKKNFDTLPEYLLLTEDLDSVDRFIQAAQDVEDAIFKLQETEFRSIPYLELAAFTSRNLPVRLCYHGDVDRIPDMLRDMVGSIVPLEFKVRGWKHRSRSFVFDISKDKANEVFPNIWRNWRGTDDSLLLIYNDLPKGRYFAAIILACRD